MQAAPSHAAAPASRLLLLTQAVLGTATAAVVAFGNTMAGHASLTVVAAEVAAEAVGAAAVDAASDAVIHAAVDALTDPQSEPAAALQQAVEQGDPTVLLPDIPDDPEAAAEAATEVAAGAAGQLFSRGAGKLAAASRGGQG